MPTFKKNKSIKGNYSSDAISNAVNDVLVHKIKVREAARKHNICHTTISRYIGRIKNVESSSEDKKNDFFANVVPPMVAVGSFVVMKVSNIDKSKNFVAQVISGPDEENDYEVTFMKRSSKVKNAFVFPEHEDLASCSHNDFVCALSSPSPVAQTSRLSNIFRFQENLALFSI